VIGLLKDRFQSLFQLHIQVYTHKKHFWAIMWIWCCIILHNLILRIEAGNIDSEWQEELYQIWNSIEGAEHWRRQEEAELGLDDESKDEMELQRAHRQVMSDGQKFRHKVMSDLFNSPTSGAVRCT
jgi:hypothetical protein